MDGPTGSSAVFSPVKMGKKERVGMYKFKVVQNNNELRGREVCIWGGVGGI